MSITFRKNLPLALSVICKEIEKRVSLREPKLEDTCLWYELSCCLLSSQVPYALAIEAANTISSAQVLLDANISNSNRTNELKKILNTPLQIDGKYRKYRFPNSRAEQLSNSCAAIRSESNCIKSHIQSFNNPRDLRTWFVNNAPGIGPKQASMFIRNICHSYELAIMDRHVIEYMRLMGLYKRKSNSISSLSDYNTQEKVISKHATERGYPIGILDWAIWIVMRELKSLEASEIVI